MSPDQERSGRSSVPPRCVFRIGWALHRVGYAISGGRLGPRSGSDDRLGTLRLRRTGRSSGVERAVMPSHLPVGDGFSVVASNTGATYPPAWWSNLQAHPEATVEVPGRTTRLRARAAGGASCAELWGRFVERLADCERYAERAEREIPVVILEPNDEEADA